MKDAVASLGTFAEEVSVRQEAANSNVIRVRGNHRLEDIGSLHDSDTQRKFCEPSVDRRGAEQ